MMDLRWLSRTLLAFFYALSAVSCSTFPHKDGVPGPTHEIKLKTPHEVSVKRVDERATLNRITRLEKILKERKSVLTLGDWHLHDDLLTAYIQLKNHPIHGTNIRIPARSRLKVELQSFCLNSSHASPADSETFKWVKNDPDIPYYRELITSASASEIDQADTQTLLWSLQNRTHWENYPDRLKAVLKKIDPNAPFKLPSKIKDTVKGKALGYLKSQIPILNQVESAISIAEGEYYKYEDYARSVRAMTSKYPLEKTGTLSSIPDTPLYSEIRSKGYSSQNITLYNPTDETQEIDLSQYYLQPDRKDVQRIGLAGRSQQGSPDLLSRLEKVLYESMARLGIGFTPVLGDVADVYEFLTGKDFLNGQKLSWNERLLSGVGIIAGSGMGYRYAARAAYAPKEFVPKFERGFQQVAKREIDLSGHLREAREFVDQTKTARQAVQESPTLRRTYEKSNFKRTDFYVRSNGEVIPAKGYRYIPTTAPYLKDLTETGAIPARVEGNYISFKNFESPKGVTAELQVPHDAGIKVEFDTKQVLEDVKIPNGNWGRADWLEPIAKDHPQFGSGGAYQAVTSQKIQATRITDLKTGKVLYESK